jgi:hypothetical protein
MTHSQMGWIVFLAALGMMCTLLAGDVAHLDKWSDALYPAFIGGVLTHFGAVIAAFVGGKLIPSTDPQRVSDAKRSELSEKVGV